MHRASTKFLLLMGLAPLGCGGNGSEGNDEVAATETAGESGTATTNDGESGTTASTTNDGSTDSTDASTSDSTDNSTTNDSSTTNDGSTDSTDNSTTDSTDNSTTDSSTDSSTDASTDSSSSDTDNCLPEEIACDGMDEDCDDVIDNLDEELDGFCDCYNIGIIGTAGANPAANFEAWLEDKGTDATRFGTAANHVLTEADLAPYDILIVDRLTHVYSPAERQILADWLAAGHGMITMAGYANNQADRDQQNSLASASGISYAAPIYIDPVENWLVHPISEGATSVQIYGGWQVVGAGEVFVRPTGEPNNSFGTATLIGQGGAAIVFSDEWISFDSEWQAIPEVPVFWSNMIKWVGPKDFCFDPQ
ncbi:hypothetical protein ACNOYE_37350 [Nannocystaceae bacterium ST9]